MKVIIFITPDRQVFCSQLGSMVASFQLERTPFFTILLLNQLDGLVDPSHDKTRQLRRTISHIVNTSIMEVGGGWQRRAVFGRRAVNLPKFFKTSYVQVYINFCQSPLSSFPSLGCAVNVNQLPYLCRQHATKLKSYVSSQRSDIINSSSLIYRAHM